MCQGCRCLSEGQFCRYLLPRLDNLKRFIEKSLPLLKKKKKKLGENLALVREHWDFFCWQVRCMAYAHHRWLFRIFESAETCWACDQHRGGVFR